MGVIRLLLLCFLILLVTDKVFNKNVECQKYLYGLTGENVSLKCVSTKVKAGKCPKSNCQFERILPTFYSTDYIGCKSDEVCPNGFRCCYDYCFQRHICRTVYSDEDITTTLSTMSSTFTTDTEITLTSLPTTEEITKDESTTTEKITSYTNSQSITSDTATAVFVASTDHTSQPEVEGQTTENSTTESDFLESVTGNQEIETIPVENMKTDLSTEKTTMNDTIDIDETSESNTEETTSEFAASDRGSGSGDSDNEDDDHEDFDADKDNFDEDENENDLHINDQVKYFK